LSRAIPIGVPAQIVSGDTLEFDYSNSDFPVADAWTPTLILRGGTDFTSLAGHVTTAGDTYKFKVPASAFVIAEGAYRWAIYFTRGADRVTAEEGAIEVRRNPSTAVNEKTHAERMVDVLRARLEGRAIADVESYQVETRMVNKIKFTELSTELTKWERRVRRQRSPGRLGRSVEVTFVAP